MRDRLGRTPRRLAEGMNHRPVTGVRRDAEPGGRDARAPQPVRLPSQSDSDGVGRSFGTIRKSEDEDASALTHFRSDPVAKVARNPERRGSAGGGMSEICKRLSDLCNRENSFLESNGAIEFPLFIKVGPTVREKQP